MRDDYHSAHYQEPPDRPIDGFAGPAGLAFAYDLTHPEPLPAAYAQCDVFYSDPPWRSGYERFNRRAGVAGPTYRDFMAALARHVDALGAPVVLVTGKHAAKLLPAADWTVPIQLNEHAAVGYGYRMPQPPGMVTTAPLLLGHLASRYSCIGDFCCGCGNAGRMFAAAGKRFVMSDVNRRCIGYIAEHVFDWMPKAGATAHA